MIVFRCTPTTPYRKLLNIVFWVTYPGFVGPSSILLTSNEKAPLELFSYPSALTKKITLKVTVTVTPKKVTAVSSKQ